MLALKLWMSCAFLKEIYKTSVKVTQGLLPVSYTHLDVYKRQSKHTALCSMIAGATRRRTEHACHLSLIHIWIISNHLWTLILFSDLLFQYNIKIDPRMNCYLFYYSSTLSTLSLIHI